MVAVAQLGMPCASRRVFHYGDFEALLKQLVQVGLNTKIGWTSLPGCLADVSLPELQDQVVVLRTIDLVGADYNGLAVLN